MEEKQNAFLETQPVGGLMRKYAIPCIISLLVAALSVLTVLWPLNKVGGEFLPQINEGDLLYMPSTLPGISAAEAASMLQKTDKLIMSVPEVARVFGKTGNQPGLCTDAFNGLIAERFRNRYAA